MLIIAIVVLSYINKILGVVLVLFVIMMMNRIDFLYMEGMENNSTSANRPNMNRDRDMSRNSSSTNDMSSQNAINLTPEQKTAIQEKVSEIQNQINLTPEQKTAIQEKVTEILNANMGSQGTNMGSQGTNMDSQGSNMRRRGNIDTVTTSTTTESVEGFNILETEDGMKKGKNSNSIPVDVSVKNNDRVEAFDSFQFKDNYAPI